MSTVNRASIADLVSRDFSKIFLPEMMKVAPMFPNYMNVQNSDGQYEKLSGISGLGYIPTKNEGTDMAVVYPEQMYDKTFTHATKAGEVRITKEAWEDDRAGALKKIPAMLGRAMAKTIENDAAGVFNNGFATNGPDGVPLFSASHPLAPSVSGTWANTPSANAAFSLSALEAAITRMASMVDDKGLPGEVLVPKFIVCAPGDLIAVKKVLQSLNDPDNANNTKNVVQDYNLKLLMNPFLDSTKWFVTTGPDENQMQFFWRIMPNDYADQDGKSTDAIYRVRSRYSVGYVGARGVDGSYGS